MGIPKGKSLTWFLVLRPAGVAGRMVEDPYCHSGIGRCSSPDRAPGMACSWGQPSFPAAALLAPGTHTLGVGTLPPARWHQQRLRHRGGGRPRLSYRSWAPRSWDRWACICPQHRMPGGRVGAAPYPRPSWASRFPCVMAEECGMGVGSP